MADEKYTVEQIRELLDSIDEAEKNAITAKQSKDSEWIEETQDRYVLARVQFENNALGIVRKLLFEVERRDEMLKLAKAYMKAFGDAKGYTAYDAYMNDTDGGEITSR